MSEIMKKAAKGQRKALETLYDQHKQKVYYLAKQLLRDSGRAADVTARAFTETLRKLPETEEEFAQKVLWKTAEYCKRKMAKELQLPPNSNFLIKGNFEGFAADAEQVLTQFSALQRFIFVLRTVGGYGTAWMTAYFNFDLRTVNQALEAEHRNILRILQTEESAEVDRMTEAFIKAERMVEVPRKVDEQVELVISSLAAPFEKKRKHAFLAVAGGVLLCAIVALIIIFIPKGNTYTAGDGSTANTKVSDSVKTTSTLDETLTYYADIVIKDQGTVTVKLDHKSAPVSASNFVELAESGFYDGLTFHRIIENFMMQGGDPAGDGFGGSGQNILGEFSDNGVENDLSHTRGAISMARSNDYNSASSQFFIVHEDSTHLDGSYAVFGYVTAGMEIVDAICETAQPTDGNGTIPAADQPVIETVNIRTA